MFESLSNRLTTALSGLTGKASLSDDNISATLREVRLALLEADVALEVVLPFLERVRERVLGMPVTPGLAPSQAFVRIVHDELVEVMGGQSEGLALNAQPPAVILMAMLRAEPSAPPPLEASPIPAASKPRAKSNRRPSLHAALTASLP